MTLTKVDHVIDRAASRLQEFADRAATEGLSAKLAQPLADDAAFLRKLKPSLIVKRARARRRRIKPAEGTVAPTEPSSTSARSRSAPRAEPVGRYRRGTRRGHRPRQGPRLERSCPPRTDRPRHRRRRQERSRARRCLVPARERARRPRAEEEDRRHRAGDRGSGSALLLSPFMPSASCSRRLPPSSPRSWIRGWPCSRSRCSCCS